MTSKTFLERPKVDLTNHYIIKKFNDGWFVGEIDSDRTQFITNGQLIDMGYLTDAEVKEVHLNHSPAIVIPTGRQDFTLFENQRSLESNWRSRPAKH